MDKKRARVPQEIRRTNQSLVLIKKPLRSKEKSKRNRGGKGKQRQKKLCKRGRKECTRRGRRGALAGKEDGRKGKAK